LFSPGRAQRFQPNNVDLPVLRTRGCGPFVHDDPEDRPPAIFGGKVKLHTGPKKAAHVLLPVAPPKK
jgi:hypothetical protein